MSGQCWCGKAATQAGSLCLWHAQAAHKVSRAERSAKKAERKRQRKARRAAK